MDNPVSMLGEAIVIQAINDYKRLKEQGLEEDSEKDGGSFSINEITEFFKSDWCSLILNAINYNKTGAEILRLLTSEV